MNKQTLSRKEKKNLIRLLIALPVFAVIFIIDKIVVLGDVFPGKYGWLLPFVLYLTVYLFIGYDVLWRAVRNIAHGQVFDENFLMCVATIGAFSLAIYSGATGREIEGFDEACAVLLFYQVGEFFQSYATGRSRRSISGLMDIRPDYANLCRDGQTERVDPSEVKVGDRIIVNPGEKIPLDGVVESGESALDTKALTAKLTPVARSAKTAKKNVKVTVSLDKQDKATIKELKDAGYTVKYRFYRSTKKAAGYKAAVTKKTASYTNTGGTKGTKYFYKVQVRVYDENSKLTAKTALKQCKYASRTWTKGK